MRRKSIDIRAIVMLLFALIAVALIMLQLRLSAPQPPVEIARLAGKRMGIIDSTYIDLTFRFMIKMPDRQWRLSPLAYDSTLRCYSAARSIEDQITWLLLSHRVGNDDTLAIARFGILLVENEMNSKAMAYNYLAELITSYEPHSERMKIIQQVTTPAHKVLKGAYFAVVLPADAGIRRPVWILAFLPRGEWLHVIRLQATEASYPVVKNELQAIVQQFFPLPLSLITPAHARAKS